VSTSSASTSVLVAWASGGSRSHLQTNSGRSTSAGEVRRPRSATRRRPRRRPEPPYARARDRAAAPSRRPARSPSRRRLHRRALAGTAARRRRTALGERSPQPPSSSGAEEADRVDERRDLDAADTHPAIISRARAEPRRPPRRARRPRPRSAQGTARARSRRPRWPSRAAATRAGRTSLASSGPWRAGR
jgi:hypothetical protein